MSLHICYSLPIAAICLSLGARTRPQLIGPSPSVNVLGIIVDSGLTCESQISSFVRRCFGMLVGLAKLSHQLQYETQNVIIEGLVCPYITYCLTVWGRCKTTKKYRIKKF